jgi:hypothetical protein
VCEKRSEDPHHCLEVRRGIAVACYLVRTNDHPSAREAVLSVKSHMKKTLKAIKVKDLAPKKGSEARVKGGTENVSLNRHGLESNANETLLHDTGGFAR